jgi:hypothetical protein
MKCMNVLFASRTVAHEQDKTSEKLLPHNKPHQCRECNRQSVNPPNSECPPKIIFYPRLGTQKQLLENCRSHAQAVDSLYLSTIAISLKIGEGASLCHRCG